MPTPTEQRQVLEMLAAGKITAEEADQLLEKLRESDGKRPGSARGAPGRRPRNCKQLRICIEEPGEEAVNVRVPLYLVRTGLALNALLPNIVMKKAIVGGADLSALLDLKGDDFLDAVHGLEVGEKGSGERIRMYCE